MTLQGKSRALGRAITQRRRSSDTTASPKISPRIQLLEGIAHRQSNLVPWKKLYPLKRKNDLQKRRWRAITTLVLVRLPLAAFAAIVYGRFSSDYRGLVRTVLSNRSTAGFGGWSSSSAIRLRPHRSVRAAFPHTALPEGNPDRLIASRTVA